ncbi:undecaprenyl-diphosphate phosphatase [Candidatus Uhrbacteria bacterium]|nr:undecaprenyl-diphosphate phosphatase [Candidatus Uhrbacteria bacterium]
MTVTQAVILGLVQGITEFLPISSSGFLILTPELFGWEVQSLAFDAFLHIATLLAIVAVLWVEVKSMAMALLVPAKDESSLAWRRLAMWIVLATVPVLVVGFLFQEVFQIEFRSVEIVAWSFVVWGSVLYIVDRRVKVDPSTTQLSRSGQLRAPTHVGLKRALFIGFAQAIAIIPGTSRSGITMTAGLASGLSRETAARFSFLLSIPTIAAAGFLKLGSVARGEETIALLPLVVGFLVATVSAFLTVRFLLKFLQRYTFSEIAVFRVLVGIAILLLL